MANHPKSPKSPTPAAEPLRQGEASTNQPPAETPAADTPAEPPADDGESAVDTVDPLVRMDHQISEGKG